MSFAVLSIDIIEYLPSTFHYDNFGFVFTNEAKDFQDEITYLSKNQLIYKAPLNKRDVKLSIKVTKNESLIGICDFTVPYSVLSKREGAFEKQCLITMTDSTRRLLFGGITSSTSLKVTIHTAIQYMDGSKDKIERPKTENKPVKKDSKSSQIKKPAVNISQSSQSAQGNTVTYSPNSKATSTQVKIQKKKFKNMNKPINKQPKSPINYNTDLINQEIEPKEDLEEVDTSCIEEEVTKPVEPIESEFTEFMNKFLEQNPLEKLNEIKDTVELQNYTKNIIQQLLDYQIKYYDKLKSMVNLNHKFNDLLMKYNEKYRNIIKKQNRLNERTNANEMKKDITTNINREENNQIKKILPIKNGEINFLQEIYGVPSDEKEIKIAREIRMEKEKEQKLREDQANNLLLKVMQNLIRNYGPITNILNSNNSTENEITNISNTLRKFNINPMEDIYANDNNQINNEGGQEIISNEKNVICKKYDESDKKLENYLAYFYSKRNFPKIPFIKRSNNNYEYGSQKVMIKFEGETIRVRYVGGYLLLDKFIELNAPIEEAKRKNNALKNSGNEVAQANLNKKKSNQSNKSKGGSAKKLKK